MSDDDFLLETCVERLNQLPSIQAEIEELADVTDPTGIDRFLALHHQSQTVRYACQVGRRITQAALGPIVARVRRLQERAGARPLLVLDYLSTPVGERLQAAGVEFIDAAGNMYLNNPAAYILVRGQRRQKDRPTTRSILTPTSLKLIFALLQAPETLAGNYRALAARAGVSLGSVSNTIRALEESGYLRRQRQGGHRIDAYERLLSLWELGYAEKLRPKLLLGQFASSLKNSFIALNSEVRANAAPDGYLIGGELGAAIATDYLRPQGVTLHVGENYRQLLVRLQLRPLPHGEITLLRQFGTANAWPHRQLSAPLADPLLLRAELLLENDDRLREAARQLLEPFILSERDDA